MCVSLSITSCFRSKLKFFFRFQKSLFLLQIKSCIQQQHQLINQSIQKTVNETVLIEVEQLTVSNHATTEIEMCV